MTNDNTSMSEALDRLVADAEREHQDWLEQQANPTPVEDTPLPTSWEEWAEQEAARLNVEAAQYASAEESVIEGLYPPHK